MVIKSFIDTPIGKMVAVVDQNYVHRLTYDDVHPFPEFEEQENALTRLLKKELTLYFTQKRDCFTVPLYNHGTLFQQKAWQALKNIPFGETLSYSQQALRIGNSKAVRAVASANKANKISIIIPCHRVTGKNGIIRGFNAGTQRQKWLLAHESA